MNVSHNEGHKVSEYSLKIIFSVLKSVKTDYIENHGLQVCVYTTWGYFYTLLKIGHPQQRLAG